MNKFPLTVGILLFDIVELLDFRGPKEVFSVTQHPVAEAAFDVVTIVE